MKYLLTASLCVFIFSFSFGQIEKLVVEGAIVIQDNDDPNSTTGTIRWTGFDFEGFDGTNWISLTCCSNSLPVDCDGNTYQTVQIGSQVWLTENLKATCYTNGNPITIANVATWITLSPSGPIAAYPNYDPTLFNTEGMMYNWEVAHGLSGNSRF